MYGYAGTILRVDLSNNTVRKEPFLSRWRKTLSVAEVLWRKCCLMRFRRILNPMIRRTC